MKSTVEYFLFYVYSTEFVSRSAENACCSRIKNSFDGENAKKQYKSVRDTQTCDSRSYCYINTEHQLVIRAV